MELSQFTIVLVLIIICLFLLFSPFETHSIADDFHVLSQYKACQRMKEEKRTAANEIIKRKLMKLTTENNKKKNKKKMTIAAANVMK